MARIPLVGGKLDGKEYTFEGIPKVVLRLAVPINVDYAEYDDQQPPVITTSEVYILDRIRVGNEVELPIYRSQDIDTITMIRMLLNGYRQLKEQDEKIR